MSKEKNNVAAEQQQTDSGNGKHNPKISPEEAFEKISNMTKAMNSQLTSNRPETGSDRKKLARVAYKTLVWFCAVAGVVAVIFPLGSFFLLKVIGKQFILRQTSVVIVTIVMLSLIILAAVVALLIYMWKFYKHVDAALAIEDARKIKEYEVYEQKLYAYYDKTLEKVWAEATTDNNEGQNGQQGSEKNKKGEKETKGSENKATKESSNTES